MGGSSFDEEQFFRAIARSRARALLIGRRALIALGIPVLTSDYDFWIHPDDAALFNEALAPQDFRPSRSPEETRSFGRYVLENDEHVDVFVARAVSTVDGVRVAFDDIWELPRRQLPIPPGRAPPGSEAPDTVLPPAGALKFILPGSDPSPLHSMECVFYPHFPGPLTGT